MIINISIAETNKRYQVKEGEQARSSLRQTERLRIKKVRVLSISVKIKG